MIITVVALGLLGIVFGSFVNAFVWRLHEQAALADAPKKKGKRKKKDMLSLADLSITKGRSMCPDCHHTLAAKDLVPILSWVSLGGKCRYCKKPISAQYPIVELLTGILFAVSYLAWPTELQGVGLYQFIFWLFYLVIFVILAVYDLRWFLLPDKVVFPLIGVALLEVVSVAIWQRSWSELWQPVAGGLIIFGLFYLLFQVSKGAWIGGGDVKVAFALGLIAGSPVQAFLVIFFASLLGTLASIPLFLKGKKGLKMHIPFGPYLLLATIIVYLYGDSVVTWYQNLFLAY